MSAAPTMEVEQSPVWLRADTAYPELHHRAHEKAAGYLGRTVLFDEVQVERIEDPNENTTLLAAAQMARMGDSASRRVVETNVRADIGERLFKAGHQTKVKLEWRNGRLEQDGRPVADIQGNTLKHTFLNGVMMARTKTELNNIFFFQELIAAGTLKDYDAVVWSPSPEDEQTKRDYNFFADTETCSVQLISLDGNDVTLETALVAGKADASSDKHDLEAIKKVAAQAGIELTATNASELLQYVMLVPKASIPNGISDIVKLYDQAAGGTFYGQAKPVQNYENYALECQRRNDGFDDMVQQVTDQLLSESHMYTSPFEAIERLDYWSERLCVVQATLDTTLEAAVFGAESAYHINEARLAMASGDNDKAFESLKSAQQTANSSSCPLFKGSNSQPDGEGSTDGEKEETSKNKLMNCPHCKAKVYDDPCASFLKCGGCKSYVLFGVTKIGEGISAKSGKPKIDLAKATREAELKRAEAAMAAQVDQVFEDHEEEPNPAMGKVALAGV